MNDYIRNVCGDTSRAAFLIKGEGNLLYDAGMAYSADKMIENIERELKGAPLDAVLLSHSHYDHISGIPFLRERWPEITVYGSSYAKQVLEKPSAQETIRGLSDNAARGAGFKKAPDYDWKTLCVDREVHDGEILFLGGHKIQVFETPGHTRCSVSYLVDDDILFLSETVGVFAGDWYMPCYMVGYGLALESLEKLRKVPAKRLFVSHRGILPGQEVSEVFSWLRLQMERTRKEIEGIIRSTDDEEERVKRMLKGYHDGMVSENEQPNMAFVLNAKATLKLVEKECMGGNL